LVDVKAPTLPPAPIGEATREDGGETASARALPPPPPPSGLPLLLVLFLSSQTKKAVRTEARAEREGSLAASRGRSRASPGF